MPGLLSRLSLNKQVYCIEMKEFQLISDSRQDLYQVSLNCVRGRSTKQIFSEDNQLGKSKIFFQEALFHVSQFFIDGKKGTAQRKKFQITVKGFDQNGKSEPLGQVNLDLGQLVGKLEVIRYNRSSTVY